MALPCGATNAVDETERGLGRVRVMYEGCVLVLSGTPAYEPRAVRRNGVGSWRGRGEVGRAVGVNVAM